MCMYVCAQLLCSDVSVECRARSQSRIPLRIQRRSHNIYLRTMYMYTCDMPGMVCTLLLQYMIAMRVHTILHVRSNIRNVTFAPHALTMCARVRACVIFHILTAHFNRRPPSTAPLCLSACPTRPHQMRAHARSSSGNKNHDIRLNLHRVAPFVHCTHTVFFYWICACGYGFCKCVCGGSGSAREWILCATPCA